MTLTQVPQQQQQAIVDQPTVGIDQNQPIALRISALQQRYAALLSIKETLLRRDVDFGKVGDSEKDSLWKPGAEKLAMFFNLHVRYEFTEREEDFSGKDHGGEPFFRYLVRAICTDENGTFLGDHYGEINSYDARYRWRWTPEHKLPQPPPPQLANCERRIEYTEEFEWAIQKRETGGKWGKPPQYWDDFQAAISDGRAIPFQKKQKDNKTGAMVDKPAYRMETTSYRLPNGDIASLVNTMIKMALKRAYVGVVIQVTGASEFFTQDLEDMDETTLENIGIRKGRTISQDATATESEDQSITRQGRRTSESPAKSKSTSKIDWHKVPGSNLVPTIRRLTKIGDLPTLFAMLEAAGDTINLSMTAEQIAAVLTNAPAAQEQPPEPVESPTDTNAADDVDPADLPF